MSQPDFDQLLRQLSAEDPQERRSAAKRLGDLRRPEAIPDLANVYSHDTDETVRKAAAESLKIFRRMEREYQLDDEPRRGGPSSGALRRIRGLLTVTLVLSVLGNVALFVTRTFPNLFAPGKAGQTAPTAREQLTDSFGKRIDSARTEAGVLRGVYSDLQGLGARSLGANQAKCEKLQSSDVNPIELGELDGITYPDLKLVSDQLNQAVIALVPLRTNFVVLCNTKDPGEVDKQLAAQGGAAKIITAIDSINNKDLAAAQAGLRKAITNPAPTVGPTSTPTPLPTPTPAPTSTTAPATATVPATATTAGATPGGPTPVAVATGATPGTPTAAGTLGNTITFNGLGLQTLKNYRYLVNADGQGTFASNGRTFTLSLKFAANRQTSPLAAEYDLNITNTGSRDFTAVPGTKTPLMKDIADLLFLPGNWTITIVDKVYYQVNNQTGKCQGATRVGDKSPIDDIDFPELAGVTLTLQQPDEQINGVNAKHYHGEKKGGPENPVIRTFDVYLSTDNQVPVRIVETVTQPTFGAKTPAPTGMTDFKMTLRYDLQAQNTPDFKILKPIACNGVPVK
jgi:HEAT repeats